MTPASGSRGLLRRGLSLVGATVVAIAASAAEPLSAGQRGEDFEALWNAIDSDYAYLDPSRASWKRLRAAARRKAENAGSREDFVAALEAAIAALHDDNISLSERSRDSLRRVPYETDIWAAWKGGAATIEAVRTYSDADVAGLQPGDVVTRIDGVPIERAVRDFLGTSPRTPAAMDWALRHVLAGPRSGMQRIQIRDGRPDNVLAVERRPPANSASPIVARRMGDARDIGYLRLRPGTDDDRIVEHDFDEALRDIAGTRGLILDLRDATGPGSRAVTQAILARFVFTPRPWQMRQARGKPRVTETIEPRGAVHFSGPVVVLVDRWTAGEGETLAEGLRTLADARIVGTRTAGLRGEHREVTLPHSAIVVRFPGEKAFRMNGEPREDARPALEVNLAAPQGGPGDPILYQALKLLEPCPGPACRSAPGSPPPARAFPPR